MADVERGSSAWCFMVFQWGLPACVQGGGCQPWGGFLLNTASRRPVSHHNFSSCFAPHSCFSCHAWPGPPRFSRLLPTVRRCSNATSRLSSAGRIGLEMPIVISLMVLDSSSWYCSHHCCVLEDRPLSICESQCDYTLDIMLNDSLFCVSQRSLSLGITYTLSLAT